MTRRKRRNGWRRLMRNRWRMKYKWNHEEKKQEE